MTYVLYGAAGMLVVLGLLALGGALGWRAHRVWQEHTRTAAAQEATEEERRQLAESQRAFEGMLHYNTEQAYGMHRGLAELAGGEG